jgi:hypothetical protein
MVVGDPVLHEMAVELRQALMSRGLDPADPPARDGMPADKAFAEYLKRGGEVYDDKDLFAKSLVESVASM